MSQQISIVQHPTVEIIELCRKWTGVEGEILAVNIEASSTALPTFTMKVRARAIAEQPEQGETSP